MSEEKTFQENANLFRRAVKAVESHDNETLVEVLSQGFDPDFRPEANIPTWHSLLIKTISAKNVEALDILLGMGAGKKTTQDQNTALTTACDGDNELILHLLMEAGFNSANLPHTTARHPVLEDYRSLPNISLSHEPENLKARLFKKGANGNAPLDNPRVWHNFEAIAEVLEAQGTPITKDDLFGINHSGETWLNVAVKCRAFDAVQAHLGKQGDAFTLADIRQEEGLMDLLVMKGNAPSLFTYDMLAPEGGEKGLRELQKEVPQDALWQVKNLSQLRQELRSLADHRTGIGR